MFKRWMKPFYWLTTMIGEFTFEKLGKETTKIIEVRKKDPSVRVPHNVERFELDLYVCERNRSYNVNFSSNAAYVM